MRLDRNSKGRGKYGIINRRRLDEFLDVVGESRNAKNMTEVACMKVREAIQLLQEEGILSWGDTPETEFFVIKLKDLHAPYALRSYGTHALAFDREYGIEVLELADRSGTRHPNAKLPD